MKTILHSPLFCVAFLIGAAPGFAQEPGADPGAIQACANTGAPPAPAPVPQPKPDCDCEGAAPDAGGSQGPAVSGGPGASPGGAPCANSGGSYIDNATFNHVHFGYDYDPAKGLSIPSAAQGGCTACSAAGTLSPSIPAGDLASLGRIHSLRDITYPSSLGPGVFLRDDKTMTVTADASGNPYILYYDPEQYAARKFTVSGNTFVDAVANSARAIRLLDAAGNPTTVRADAVSAQWVGRDGRVLNFELFRIDDNRVGGRLVSVLAQGGRTVKSYSYLTPVSEAAASPATLWAKSAITDGYGHTLALTNTTLPNGSVVLSSVALPGGASIAYAYDTAGNLASVALPSGDTSTFTRTVNGNFLDLSYAEATETGEHRNKTARLSNNISATTINTFPLLYNQSSLLIRTLRNGDGELSYWNGAQASTGQRYIYDGGDVMRLVNNGDRSAYLKSWTLDPSKQGWSSITNAVAAADDTYLNAHDPGLAKGQPSQFREKSGVLHAYGYDAAGNWVSDATPQGVKSSVYDATLGKPVVTVDEAGTTTLATYDDSGNLLTRRTGLVARTLETGGAVVDGLLREHFSNITGIGALDSATPDAKTTAFSIPSTTTGANYGLRYSGSLNVPSDGERTFTIRADDNAHLYIDGVKVLEVAYSQGAKSVTVNLTAGRHDFRLDYHQAGGGQSLLVSWTGPETTGTDGVALPQPISPRYLSHTSVVGETGYVTTPESTLESWTWCTASNLRDLIETHTAPDGKVTRYSYDATRRPVQVEETGDAGTPVTVATYAYDPTTGDLASSTDALGRTVQYVHDARRRLVKTSYADGTTETFTYGAGVNANLVVESKDRAGSVTRTDYDHTGRAVTVRRGYALADNDGAITQTLPNPSVTVTAYVSGRTEPLTRTVDGKETRYAYDYARRVVSTETVPAQNARLAAATTYASTELRLCETDAHGCRTFYAYRDTDKALAREIRESVPGALNAVNAAFADLAALAASPTADATILAVARAAGANPGYAVTDYTRDNRQRVTLRTDPDGVRTAFTYDALGRVTTETRAQGLPVAAVTTRTYDAADRPLSMTDALGRVTANEFFPSGRLKKTTLPDARTREFTYFADGKLATSKDEDGFISKRYWSPCCGRDAGNADPLGQGQVRFTDGEGRVTYVATVKNVEAARAFGPNLPADAVVAAQTMKYDARGRLAATTRWLVVPASVNPKNPPVATDPTQGLTTTYAYFDDLTDARFAPVLAKLAEQGVTLTAGSATVVTNPAGEQSFTVADGAGRPVTSGVFFK